MIFKQFRNVPIVALLLGAIVAGSSTGCNQTDPNTIRVVSSLPRTGSAKQQTDSIVNGIRMAFEEIDYKVGEYKIDYQDWDDATASAGQWTPEREAANAKKAVQDPHVMAYIGTYNSGAAETAIPILNQAALLMISPANTAVELTKIELADPIRFKSLRPTGKNNYCRVIATDDKQAPFGVDWAKEMGVKTVAVLDDTEVYGRGLATLFNEYAAEAGLKVVYRDSIDVKSQEFRSLMTKIKAFDPDLIYFGGTTQSKGGQIVKDMVAAGLKAKFMVPDGCYEQAFIDSAGADNVNGRAFVTFGGMPPSEQVGRGKKFVEKYKVKYKVEPEAYAVYGYECGKAVIEAIRIAGKKDRAAITSACLGIKDFEGTIGTWSFDANGDITNAQLSGLEIKDGKFVFAKGSEPAKSAK